MDAASLLRLVALAAIGGGSFLFMRVSVPAFGPVALICLRVSIAAAFLWITARLLRRAPIDLRNQWRHLLALGLCNFALPFTLFAYAAQSLTASMLAIVNASSPIFGALIAAVWLRRTFTGWALLGLAIGLGGVAVIVGGNLRGGDTSHLAPLSAALVASACYGLAGCYTRWAKLTLPPNDMAHGSLWFAALLLLPLTFVWPMRQAPEPGQWAAVATLGVLCTGAANLLYFRLLRDTGPMRALSFTFLIPVFGGLWGALFLGERVGPEALAGGTLVLLGTALTNGLLPPRREG